MPSPLSAVLARGVIAEGAVWRGRGGRPIAALHRAGGGSCGILNAHNILLDPKGTVSIIDFDRGPGCADREPWGHGANLQRLRRSLVKIRAFFPRNRGVG